jgi:N-acetylneuraminic acid mutarotase
MLRSTLQMLFALFLSSLLTATLSHPTHQPSWTPLAPLPLPRQEHTTVFLPPSTIAVLGGIIPTNDTSPLPITTTSLMQFYTIPNNTWTTAAPLPLAMNHINAAVVDGRIYVLGGLADLGEMEPAWRAVGDAFVYDPCADTWTRLPNLPDGEARGSAAVGVSGSRIVLAGGMTDLELSGNRTQNTVAVVSVFDTESGEWETVIEAAKYLPEGRDHAAAAVVEGRMYVLGGREQGQENVKDTVFVLNLADLEAGWTVSSARMPTPRGGVAASVVRQKVYVLGGEGNAEVESGVFGEVEVYDTRKDRWASAGSMRIPRHGTYAVGVGKRVYVPGGGVRQSGAPVLDFDVFAP